MPKLATARQAELRLQLNDALAVPTVEASLRADGILAAGQALDRVVATAEGTLDRLTVAIDLHDEMLAVNTRADTVSADGETRIEVAALTAGYGDIAASLVDPARITLVPDGVVLDGLVAGVHGGPLMADGR